MQRNTNRVPSEAHSLARYGAWVESVAFKHAMGQKSATDSAESIRIRQELRADGVSDRALDLEFARAWDRGTRRAARKNPGVTRYKTTAEMRRAGVPDIIPGTSTLIYESGRQVPLTEHAGHFISPGPRGSALMRRRQVGGEGEFSVVGLHDMWGERHHTRNGKRRNGRRVWHVEFHPAVGQTARLKQIVERWSGKLNTTTYVATFAAADDAENATEQASDWGIAGRDTRRAKPVEGRARRNCGCSVRANGGKGAFVLAKRHGLDTKIVSRHDTRAAAVAAMQKKTGGYGPDSQFTQGYMILDVSPSGGWEVFESFGKKELRPRARWNGARRNSGGYTDAQVKKLARGYGNTMREAEDAQNSARVFAAEDAYNAWWNGLPPRQQKIATQAHIAAHFGGGR